MGPPSAGTSPGAAAAEQHGDARYCANVNARWQGPCGGYCPMAEILLVGAA